MSTIREFVNNMLSSRVDEDGNKDYQCVALAKYFTQKVFGKKLGYFSWSAKNWWANRKTLLSDYDIYENNWSNKPKRWDIIFWNNWTYWHVAIVMAYYKDFVYVLEQNFWSWNWDWLWENAIKIRKKNISGSAWWGRFKNISWIINKDFFDKIVFEKGLYIWETDFKRKDIVEFVFYFLAGYKDNLNWKTKVDMQITKNLNFNTTRQELAYIILSFLNKILNKNLTLQDLKNVWIWNWQRPNDKVSGYEFTLMINKTKEVYGL